MIIIKGMLDAKRVGFYNEREFAILQFIVRDERGALQLIEVNLPDGTDHSAYIPGEMVEITISVSFSKKTGKIYYRAHADKVAA